TTMLNLFQKSGNGLTAADAAQIKQVLYDTMYTIGMQNDTESLSQDFYTNVFASIGDTQVTWTSSTTGKTYTDTLYDIMQNTPNSNTGNPNGYTAQDLADAFNALNPAPTGNPP